MKSHWKGVIVAVVAAAVAACSQSSPISPSATSPGGLSVKTGNGAPSGGHYNLNIIGVNTKENMPNNLDSGNVIFVKLWGADTKIMLIEGDDYQVLDKNGTDGVASFQLPNPDPDGNGTTTYSVFARALGNPGGSADMTTCATDPSDDSTVCSVITLELDASGRPAKFENVSKWLLYIYADLNGDGTTERYPLFDDALEGYFWDYDNSGLKLAQLRFYECSSTVPGGSTPGGGTTTTCFN